MRHLAIFGIIIVLVVVLGGCTITVPTPSQLGVSTATGTSQSSASTATGGQQSTFGPKPNWGVATKTTGCQASGELEDKACTPGDILPDATKDKICVSGYAGPVRNVPQSTKDKVYAEYGVKHHTAGEYEVDHLVSLELGGSNDISNLWPQPATPKPGFHEKDRVENYMHDQVCKGSITLQEAQIEIATNWLAIYQRMPASNTSESSSDQS